MQPTVVVAMLLTSVAMHAQRPRQEAQRTLIVFVDDLHLQFQHTPRQRDLLQRLARVAVEAGPVGVVTTGSSSVSLAPTSDTAHIERMLLRITGGGLKPVEFHAALQSDTGRAEIAHRVAVSLGTLRSLVETAGRQGLRPLILYVSGGYPLALAGADIARSRNWLMPGATIHAIAEQAYIAPEAAATVPGWDAYIQAIDGSLRELVSGTGGSVATTSAELDALLSRLAQPAPTAR